MVGMPHGVALAPGLIGQLSACRMIALDSSHTGLAECVEARVRDCD
jgi:hypothetical protein